MATQVRVSRGSPSRKVGVEMCPYCGQPLLNHEAVRQVEKSEREAERKLETAAKARAVELAKAATARLEAQQKRKVEQQKKKVEQLQQSLAATQAQHRDELRELRIKVRAEADTEAERAAQARVRKELREKDRALNKFKEQVDVQARQIEHLTSNERGDFNEDRLLQELRVAFPDDRIERRGHGRAGGDILHEVRTRTEDGCSEAGLIVYECKDTLNWSNAFIAQARKEGATHKTPYLVIITRAFPGSEKTLCVRDGVIVVHPSRAIELAQIMRRMVEQVHRASLTADDKASKDAELYEYLAGADFRQAFETLTASSDKLGELLGKERTWHERSWAKRQAIHNELSSKTTAIDTRIRTIVEKQQPSKTKVVRLARVS
jgi:hypothetical protein